MKSQILMLILGTLVGCGGGGKGTAQLEITHSFAAGNASFDGGLFIQGKDLATGEEFTAALPTGHKASIDLKFGNYEIKAVGWDEGGNGNQLEGKVLCAIENVNFATSQQTVSLKVSVGKCFDSAFANLDVSAGTINEIPSSSSSSSSSASSSSGGGISTPGSFYYFQDYEGSKSIKQLKVTACGAMYNINDPSKLRYRTPALASYWCNDYPVYFKEKPKFMQIVLSSKNAGTTTTSLKSACFPANGSGVTFPTAIRMPTKIPVAINFFDEEGCGEKMNYGAYVFPKGLDAEDLSMDKLIYPADSGIYLALVTPISKKGTTPFITEIPIFNCQTNTPTVPGYPCLSLPNLPSNYSLDGGMNYINLPPGINCSGSLTGNPAWLTSGYCEVRNGKTLLGLNVDSMTAVEGPENFNFDGQNFTFYYKQGWNSVLRNLVSIIGFNDIGNYVIDSLANSGGGGNHNRSGGVLGDIQGDFSPMILGGFFWDQECTTSSMNAPVTRSTSFYEEGSLRTYQVTMTNSPVQHWPNYIINHTNPRWSGVPTNPFNRRFIIRKLVSAPLAYKTEKIIDIACDGGLIYNASANSRIGRMEELRVDVDGAEIEEERKLVYWNTTDMGHARFEVYKLNTEYNSDWTSKIESSFERAEKFPNSLNDAYKVTQIRYHYNLGNESFSHNEIDGSSTMITNKNLMHMNMSKTPGPITPGSIFNTDVLHEEKHKVRYGTYNNYPGANALSGGFKHSYLGKYIWAYEQNGDVKMEAFDGTSYIDRGFFGAPPKQIAVDISINGNKYIVAVSSATGQFIHYKVWDGLTMNAGTFLVPIGVSIVKLRAAILNNGNYMIAALGDDAGYMRLLLAQNDAGTYPDSANIQPHGDYGFYLNGTDKIEDIELAKDDTNFHLIMNHYDFSSPNHLREVSSCIFDASEGTPCAPTPIKSFGLEPSIRYVSNLSANVSNDGTKMYVSFSEGPSINPPTSYLSFAKNQGQAWAQTGSYPRSQYSIERNSMPIAKAFDTANYIGSGTITQIYIPYAPPSIPGFRMNFSSLKPSDMLNTVFTSKGIFENTQ